MMTAVPSEPSKIKPHFKELKNLKTLSSAACCFATICSHHKSEEYRDNLTPESKRMGILRAREDKNVLNP